MKGAKGGGEPRKFTVEFKEAAVRRLLGGESGSSLSRELRRGIFHRWLEAYRAEGVPGLSRKPGRPPAGQSRPPKSACDRRDERIAEFERLLGQQAAEVHFPEQPFRALNLATPGHDAPGASGSTRPSSGSAPKARSASNDSACPQE